MNNKLLLSVALFALAASLAPAKATAPATPPAKASSAGAAQPAAKPYPLKTCLVTDNDLDSMGDEVSIIYQGQTVKFCCKPCEKKFLRSPEKYLAKLAELAAVKK